MTPVNRMAGTGERTREPSGETPGIFIVLSGFATTDLSVRFCDACQGAEPMEKRPLSGLSFPSRDRSVSRAFTHAPAARRSRTAGA
jgi:hypothetical protein